jgi:hypothetical protein
MEFLIVLATLAIVTLFVTRPLWRTAGSAPAGAIAPEAVLAGEHRSEIDPVPDELAELEAARDAKYREIRDAELDRRTGKLSEDDYEAIDRALRAEAVEILNALDEARDRLPSAD